MNYQASNPESLSDPRKAERDQDEKCNKETSSRSANFLNKLEQLDCMTVAKLFNFCGHLQEVR